MQWLTQHGSEIYRNIEQLVGNFEQKQNLCFLFNLLTLNACQPYDFEKKIFVSSWRYGLKMYKVMDKSACIQN